MDKQVSLFLLLLQTMSVCVCVCVCVCVFNSPFIPPENGFMLVCLKRIMVYSMLLLLSHFSHVQLCATPRRQPTRLLHPWEGFSRQEHWSGLPFPSPIMKVKSHSEVAQSCPTLHDPMDCSLPGSSVHGIFQARVLEWGAIAFSRFTL